MRNDNVIRGDSGVEKEIKPKVTLPEAKLSRPKAGMATSQSDGLGRATVVIHNRDIPLLADVLSIMQEICQIEQRRDWQRDRMLNITQHLTGMPGGGGVPRGLDEAFALLSELDEEHEQRCKDYVRQLKAAQKIINGIESRSMRTFVIMKYVMDVSDTDIRQELNMTRTGFNRARRCVESAECMEDVKWRERYILANVKKL